MKMNKKVLSEFVMKEKRVSKNLINAYVELRNKCSISVFKNFNVVIIMQPKVLYELMGELLYGIQRDIDVDCYFINLCGNKTPIIISNELQDQVEFEIMTQEEYERMEQEKMITKFNKMFFQY